MKNEKLKIVFMGTPEFGAIILEGLIKGNYKPCLVITAPDKPVGRKQILTPPPVKQIAQKYNTPIEQPEKILNLKSEILNLTPDLIVVAAYVQILPKEILEIPKFGCLNVHPSLLPRWRGPSPIQYTILNGDEKTGVTIIKMTEKVDSGPIVAQKELSSFTEKETYQTLHNQLAEKGAKLLFQTIPKWIKGEIKPEPQDESKTTYTKILTREDGEIDWKKSAEAIERQIRAFDPWPGGWTFWPVLKDTFGRIKILEAKIFKSPDSKTYPIGKVLVIPQNKAAVQCGRDFLLIEKLQIEGKREMNSEEFLRGHPDFIGTILK